MNSFMPGKAVLFVPFYTPARKSRCDELMHVLHQNLCHEWLEKVVLMVDDNTFSEGNPPSPRICVKNFSQRPTYSDWLQLSAQHATSTELSICANADIELSSDFLEAALREFKHIKTILCISRHDISPAGEVALRDNPHWTQDTWCLKPHEAKEAMQEFQHELLIPFGIPRCDNRLAYIFWLRNWLINNPCHRVKTIHHQKDEERGYSKKDATLLGGVAFVHPSPKDSDSSNIEIEIFSLSTRAPSSVEYNKWLPKVSSINSCFRQDKAHSSLTPKQFSTVSLNGKTLALSSIIARDSWKPVYSYNHQFKIYKKDNRIAFVDSDWPSMLTYDDPGIDVFDAAQLKQCFFWGFCPPVTQFIPNHFASRKLFLDHKNFWQYPCRTEEDAFERHTVIESPVFNQTSAHTYIGLPWATWIDTKNFPEALISAFGERLSAVRIFLENIGIKLYVHTVCQSIYWKRDSSMRMFKIAGISDIWISHKEKGWDAENGFDLHAWPLYAVNALEPGRQEGMAFIPVHQKKVFASFKGAYMKHYLSDVRLRLGELKFLDDYIIEISDLWHFNPIVYGYQVRGLKEARDAGDLKEVIYYNQLLSESVFSLCPVGAGPNTLRLWESLAIGSIPVVLSDRYCYPKSDKAGVTEEAWQESVISVPEDKVQQLDTILRDISLDQLKRMQLAGRQLFDSTLKMRCF